MRRSRLICQVTTSQPARRGNGPTFVQPAAAVSTHDINWTPERVAFQSRTATGLIARWALATAACSRHGATPVISRGDSARISSRSAPLKARMWVVRCCSTSNDCMRQGDEKRLTQALS